jgi:hypothetical protein
VVSRKLGMMSAEGFIELLVIAAVFIAAWLDVRLGDRRPSSPLGRVGHAFAAYVVLEIATAGFAVVLRKKLPIGEQMPVLFAAYLPSLIYAFLSVIWLMRTFVDVARLARR